MAPSVHASKNHKLQGRHAQAFQRSITTAFWMTIVTTIITSTYDCLFSPIIVIIDITMVTTTTSSITVIAIVLDTIILHLV